VRKQPAYCNVTSAPSALFKCRANRVSRVHRPLCLHSLL